MKDKNINLNEPITVNNLKSLLTKLNSENLYDYFMQKNSGLNILSDLEGAGIPCT